MGCTRRRLEDCGWVRPPGPPRVLTPQGGSTGIDERTRGEEAKREAREREDKEIWSKTSKLLEPWSEALVPS